ncbi:Ankyrin repeat domain-containing protein [Plasmodiophora brassicae]|uniref:Uncharacterized protein n=1 Tax=Plasmodiophora brassicae TaxID=37360 RepID=A0A0G4IXK3_PLABS|nr:hypothetical protein PBRA_007510 [Plasmodiophora brassicae]SPQ97063.1 unnamed protein product [Plasmodiophora brassicae]
MTTLARALVMATMACQVAGSADHLHLAAIRCQTRLVEAILDHDASLVNRDLHFGRTALFFIIESGLCPDEATREDLVQNLIARGASVHVRQRNVDLTPLHYAAFYHQAGVAEILLRAEPLLATATDFLGRHVLHFAIWPNQGVSSSEEFRLPLFRLFSDTLPVLFDMPSLCPSFPSPRTTARLLGYKRVERLFNASRWVH